MESPADSENYWHRSTHKGFNFDDDEDDGAKLGSLLGAGKWDVTNKSDNILNDDAISEASFDSSALAGALNLSIKSIVNEETLQIILAEQTLDDRESYVTKGATPDDELKFLRRQIQTLLYHPAAEVTAHKLLLGKNVPLDVFKSLHEKEQLLDAILQYGAGDALIYVLLFCKRTLTRDRFHQLLLARAVALRHYISYLQQSRHAHEAWELLQLCGKQQEAALMQFTAAFASKDLSTRKTKLTQLLQRYKLDATMTVIPVYQQIFEAAVQLIQLVETQSHALDNSVNINSTPIEVLYACCKKHNNWKEADLTRAISPFRLSAEQHISPAQFEWTALHERACAQAYADLECVFERVSSWTSMKQKQFHISFSLETAICRLHALQAPTSVIYLFLSKMSNNTEKLNLAKRVKCTKAVIDALSGLKDVIQLTQLKDSLAERSEEQFYCDKALKSLQSKRWSTDNIKLKL